MVIKVFTVLWQNENLGFPFSMKTFFFPMQNLYANLILIYKLYPKLSGGGRENILPSS